MKIPALNIRVLISWGAVVAILILVMTLLAPLLGKLNTYNTEISRDARMLDKLQSILASKDYILQTYNDFESNGFEELVYDSNQSITQISLEIQTRITDIITNNGAIIRTVKPHNKVTDQYRASGVKINFSGSLESMMHIINEIEISKPFMVIEAMDLKSQQKRSRARRGRKRNSKVNNEVEQLMLVQLTVVSYAL